ncbi:MET16 (YPR167C) [Zygosaccharomyces parabailii]|uniref:phosphoadenylyl-sulfate reductase (thioredoxin) n=1 Tax=Zygosaccharomyces bailii (strain CLIB 213 / ATCC 58445 / CBS 680 / BCRC 21525 / NBRC 1098 / NCYC 1416 / NRRL Y-2227) TaxID=1333698 RepID=A0A8J2T5Z2_ZYGB2|nr:MET16 (YPR167C) [Zygosaccharomyces parabailii]CDF88619.1 BN860_14466g1_1 [Zygosaccharomyces bailii CLIB 213]CDH14504.1 probable Phosphoadenosine phosphosulfate reductase [Zygosaccharomyces bailii ISA1307]SJM82434.1 probable Phosphoadenosine phosphosulfate reductase [Zygosaccharomyces bailii]
MSFQLNNGVVVTQEQLDHWNQSLSQLESPQQVLQWALITFPHLYQTTAFGLTGLATIDMLSRMNKESEMVPLIFIDTLHQFPQTLELLQKVEDRYYAPLGQKIHIFKPEGCSSEQDFAQKYGDFLWEKDEDRYDFLVKVEPAHRAYKELSCTAVLTGRRKSQGASRAQLQFVELDELNGIIKINPLALWDFDQVHAYIKEHNMPYNELLDLGYKSIGDYHSTQPVAEGEDERAGRWKGKAKTECGIHETSRFAQFLNASKT